MRGDQLVRQHRIIERLRDGKARTLAHLDDIRREYHVIPKTLRRDLAVITRIPELQITTFRRFGETWYRSMAAPHPAESVHGVKLCNKCGEPKAIEEFGLNRRNADGHETQCLDCRNRWRRDWVARNRTRVNARLRRWRSRSSRAVRG